jgi:hypothetical protein
LRQIEHLSGTSDVLPFGNRDEDTKLLQGHARIIS